MIFTKTRKTYLLFLHSFVTFIGLLASSSMHAIEIKNGVPTGSTQPEEMPLHKVVEELKKIDAGFKENTPESLRREFLLAALSIIDINEEGSLKNTSLATLRLIRFEYLQMYKDLVTLGLSIPTQPVDPHLILLDCINYASAYFTDDAFLAGNDDEKFIFLTSFYFLLHETTKKLLDYFHKQGLEEYEQLMDIFIRAF